MLWDAGDGARNGNSSQRRLGWNASILLDWCAGSLVSSNGVRKPRLSRTLTFFGALQLCHAIALLGALRLCRANALLGALRLCRAYATLGILRSSRVGPFACFKRPRRSASSSPCMAPFSASSSAARPPNAEHLALPLDVRYASFIHASFHFAAYDEQLLAAPFRRRGGRLRRRPGPPRRPWRCCLMEWPSRCSSVERIVLARPRVSFPPFLLPCVFFSGISSLPTLFFRPSPCTFCVHFPPFVPPIPSTRIQPRFKLISSSCSLCCRTASNGLSSRPADECRWPPRVASWGSRSHAEIASSRRGWLSPHASPCLSLGSSRSGRARSILSRPLCAAVPFAGCDHAAPRVGKTEEPCTHVPLSIRGVILVALNVRSAQPLCSFSTTAVGSISFQMRIRQRIRRHPSFSQELLRFFFSDRHGQRVCDTSLYLRGLTGARFRSSARNALGAFLAPRGRPMRVSRCPMCPPPPLRSLPSPAPAHLPPRLRPIALSTSRPCMPRAGGQPARAPGRPEAARCPLGRVALRRASAFCRAVKMSGEITKITPEQLGLASRCVDWAPRARCAVACPARRAPSAPTNARWPAGLVLHHDAGARAKTLRRWTRGRRRKNTAVAERWRRAEGGRRAVRGSGVVERWKVGGGRGG